MYHHLHWSEREQLSFNKRSYTEMADSRANFSFSNSHHPSSLQPQSPPQLQVTLPHNVEQLLNQICDEKYQPQPDPEVRRRLSLLSEEKAVELLGEIYRAREIRTLNGFINFLLGRPKYQSNSPSSSPSKSASPITPVRHQEQHRGLRLLYSSASPSKDAGSSPYHGPSSAPPSNITPVDLFPDPPPPQDQHGGMRSFFSGSSTSPSQAGRVSPDQCSSSALPSTSSPVRLSTDPHPPPQGDTLTVGQAVLEALGEIEFRKQFLLLNYAGEHVMKLENVIRPETIRSWRYLPMQLFETRVWEALGQYYIDRKERRVTFDWDSGKPCTYQCEVSVDGSYRLKGPYLHNIKRTLLQKYLGDDNVLMVKFTALEKEESPSGSYYNYTNYGKVSREGIFVGLRRYCFFVFKDGGNKEKKINPSSSCVKCYFVCVASDAAIDRGRDNRLSNRAVHEIRCLFMHPHTVSNVAKYMARFSLILSKTESLIVDWSCVKVEDIDDVYCLDENGNCIYKTDGKPLIHTDGTGFISEDLALLCPKDLLKGDSNSKGDIQPLLIQFRLFYKGRAVKGTCLVNKRLPPQTIQIRPSMVKVDPDPTISDHQAVNSMEIVQVSKNSRRNTCFSRNLIALLCQGGVPKEYFMELLIKDLEDTRSVFCNEHAANKVATGHGDIDDDYTSVEMISSGIPLEESYLQYRLSILSKEEKKGLKKGRIASPESYMLMGTSDPTGILDKDEVCIVLDIGQLSGEVLVYRHPGIHFGDIHVLKATYVKELECIVGTAKFGIFFSSKGPRSVADEMGGGDFDGDLYWISKNPQLLKFFKPSEPWIETSSTPKVSGIKPSQFVPSQLLPNDLEDALIQHFLTTRFEPSYSMSMASDNWVAFMDQFLTLGDASSDEKMVLKAKMEQLVDLYYEALDAPKKGGEVEIPNELKPQMFPHYMGKKNSYRSASILGQIYDTVTEYEAEEVSPKEIKKLPIFEVEVPEKCLEKWSELHRQYRREMSSALTFDGKEGKDNAAETVMKKYKEILYGAKDYENKTRPENEIFDEALAIYHIVYDYAIREGAVSKCGFTWKVAGSALCKYYLKPQRDQGERIFEITLSVMKKLMSRSRN